MKRLNLDQCPKVTIRDFYLVRQNNANTRSIPQSNQLCPTTKNWVTRSIAPIIYLSNKNSAKNQRLRALYWVTSDHLMIIRCRLIRWTSKCRCLINNMGPLKHKKTSAINIDLRTRWFNNTTITSKITRWPHTNNYFSTNSNNINIFIIIVSSRAMTILQQKCRITIMSPNRPC